RHALASSQKKRAPFRRPVSSSIRKGLDGRHVRGLSALGALHDLELDALTLGQRLVALPRDRGEVDEDVLPTGALDEAVTLLVRKPLHGALWQNRPPRNTSDGTGTAPPTVDTAREP